MSGSNNQPIWAQVLVAFLPVFFGSFLFAGVLENYRNDSRLEGTIIEKNFTPMRELQGSCHTSHNDLYLQYGNLSGSYQLMFNELEHIFSTPESELGRDYEVLLKSIFQTHSETNIKTSELKETVANCRLELFRKYESLALMTGAYDKFSNMVDEKVTSINKVYDERSELPGSVTLPPIYPPGQDSSQFSLESGQCWVVEGGNTRDRLSQPPGIDQFVTRICCSDNSRLPRHDFPGDLRVAVVMGPAYPEAVRPS